MGREWDIVKEGVVFSLWLITFIFPIFIRIVTRVFTSGGLAMGRAGLALMSQGYYDTNLSEPGRGEVCSIPLLDSVKGEYVVLGPTAGYTHHWHPETIQAFPCTISLSTAYADPRLRGSFEFQKPLKEFGSPAQPFTEIIVLRLYHSFSRCGTVRGQLYLRRGQALPKVGFHIDSQIEAGLKFLH